VRNVGLHTGCLHLFIRRNGKRPRAESAFPAKTGETAPKVVLVSGDELGGMKAIARKELAEFIPYKLSWGCPQWAGGR
jgi:hypothetical protein